MRFWDKKSFKRKNIPANLDSCNNNGYLIVKNKEANVK
jgi:hypothetical protein